MPRRGEGQSLAQIGKSLKLKGEITGNEDLYSETEQAVFELKLVASGGQPELSAALAEQLLEDGFEQLPGPLPVGVGKTWSAGALPTSRGA